MHSHDELDKSSFLKIHNQLQFHSFFVLYKEVGNFQKGNKFLVLLDKRKKF